MNCHQCGDESEFIICRPCHLMWHKAQLTANSIVHRAIRAGELARAKDCICVDCGKQANDYDHRDYSKPLVVDPVCRGCNVKRGPAVPLTEPFLGALRAYVRRGKGVYREFHRVLGVA